MQRTKTDQTRLTDRQVKALPHFIGSSSDIDACKQAKVSKDTFYTWLKDPVFRAELQRLRDQVVHDAVEVLKASTSNAVATLVNLLNTPNPMLQRNVANDILNRVAKFQQLQGVPPVSVRDFETRLSEIREQTTKEVAHESCYTFARTSRSRISSR